ncbi:MAG: hypothetical protein EBT71_04305 [Alphaproteobacteria bacterium]|nr:hypothetical protein [Alphaproteobacteria bacterium]
MRLRQICLVAHELEPTLAQLCGLLQTDIIYRDPGVAHFGLANGLLQSGGDFIEVVSPLPDRQDTAGGRHLARRGDSFYMVIFQCANAAPIAAHIGEQGIRKVWSHAGADLSATHFHPADFGGAIVSVDSMGREDWQSPNAYWEWTKWPPATPPDYAAAATGAPEPAAATSALSADTASAGQVSPPAPVSADPVPQNAVPETDGPTALAIQPAPDPADSASDGHPGIPATFEDMVAMFSANGEPLLHAYLVNNVHLVKYEIGKISLRVSEGPPKDFTQNLSRCLNEWTGRAWFIEASREEGAATLQQQRDDAAARRREAAIAHPLVQMTLEAFPGAEVADVRSVADRDAVPDEPAGLPPAPDDYLSYDYEDEGFDPDRFSIVNESTSFSDLY